MKYLVLNKTKGQGGEAYARELSRRIFRLSVEDARPDDGTHWSNHFIHPVDGRVALQIPEGAEGGALLPIHPQATDNLSTFPALSPGEKASLAADLHANRGKEVWILAHLPLSKLGSLLTPAQFAAGGWAGRGIGA